MKKFLFVLVAMALVVSSGPVWAKDGFYLGMDLGIAVAPGMGINGMDTDTASTRCDGHIDPSMSEVRAGDCDIGNDWMHTDDFDGGIGVLAGLGLGYRLGNFRVEGEYFFRNTGHDSERDAVITGVGVLKDLEEIDSAAGKLNNVLSHNFFANLYYDFNSDSKFTPYLGFGVGVARVSFDYNSRFQRRNAVDVIETFNDLELRKQVAGTTTVGSAMLTDTLFGYQAIAGVDYHVSDPVTIGLKFRWADFGEFESDPREWDQLRSHPSSISPGGPRVRYKIMTDDIQFWGVSLNMKYQF